MRKLTMILTAVMFVLGTMAMTASAQTQARVRRASQRSFRTPHRSLNRRHVRVRASPHSLRTRRRSSNSGM